MVNGFRPTTIEEALEIRHNYDVVPYAGGTDWMIGRDETKTLLFLNGIPKLKEIDDDEHNIYIGTACTYTELLASDKIPQIIKDAIAGIASPAGDTLPILYALDAGLVVSTMDAAEVIDIDDFIIGPKKTTLRKDELIEQIIVPKKEVSDYYYKKVGARNADAISKLSFIGFMRQENGVIKELACAFGAVGPTVVRNKMVESILLGKTIAEAREAKTELINRYMDIIRPIDDQRSTALYRKKVAINLLKDFLEKNGI